MSHNPRTLVALWLPHTFILAILAMTLVLMFWVLEPLLPVLLMGAALSALTYPITAGPIHGLLNKKLPKLKDDTKRRMSGFLAMAGILMAIFVPLLVALAMMLGSANITDDLLMGLVNKNLNQVDRLLNKVSEQMKILQELYPAMPIDTAWIKSYVKGMLKDLLDLQPALMAFFFKGTGSLMVQVVLCVVSMVFFYAEGSLLAKGILKYTPLTENDSVQLLETFKRVVLRFMIDTIGVSLIKGTCLGLVVGLFLGLNPIILIFFASFICLLPLVGTTLIWAPAATVLYKQGHLLSAVGVILLAQGSIYMANHVVQKVGAKLHEHSATTSFFIFVSVIGGLVGMGVKGIVLGPMAVILVMVLGCYWKDYYRDEMTCLE